MRRILRKALPFGLVAAAAGVAVAQTWSPAQPPVPPSAPQGTSTIVAAMPSAADLTALREALAAARTRDYDRATVLQTAIADPVARKIVSWALVDMAEDKLGFFVVDNARRDLAGWPREDRRFGAGEKLLETSGLGPSQTIAWFNGRPPATAPGAMALASAYRAVGQQAEAAALIRDWYANKTFSLASQQLLQSRFADLLRPEDYAARQRLSQGQLTSWGDRRSRFNDAMKVQDYRTAYGAVAPHGLPLGADYAEAEFMAGWLQLRKLNNAALADSHFTRILDAGKSPITRSRGHYWRGRAAEARGDQAGAQAHYQEGAQYTTTFYGQLAAEKVGVTSLALPYEAQATADDRQRFEARELVRAIRILAAAGEKPLMNAFVLHLDDQLEQVELGLLVDLTRGYGEQLLAMNVVRGGAQRGIVLSERGYPLRTPPSVPGAPEPAFVLGIIRQESGFQPDVRSSANARGFMQLLPTTAEIVARKLGVAYDAGRLSDPEYNMRLGSKYLGDQVDRFSGSYIMAAAAYNAGPGRPAQWIGYCGDPRSGGADPIDFIECIPFSETRNYVMRVLENTQVYRARLNGNTAPITLASDLKRGAWRPGQPQQAYNGPIGGTSPY